MPQDDLIIKMQVSDRHVTIDILKVLKPEKEKKENLIHATLFSKIPKMYSPMLNTLRDVQL